MLLGICGREGAGKTTIASCLTSSTSSSVPKRIEITDPESFVMGVLFDLSREVDADHYTIRDSIWKLSFPEACVRVKILLRQKIDSNFEYPKSWTITLPQTETDQVSKGSWVEFSFAEPLKKIASVIFGIPYEILLGAGEKERDLREKTMTSVYDRCGSLNGRQCLEFLGTDVFRNCFDLDVWTKIFRRNAAKAMSKGINIVLSDVRFDNELFLINSMNGILITVFRDPRDLILTLEDQKKHPAKWKFLTFYSEAKKLIMIPNIGSREQLEKIIKNLIARMEPVEDPVY
jgi:energy-coupling factor transporter ATP-binding protein EcfA2